MNDKNQIREDMNCVDKYNSDQRTDQGVTGAPEPVENVLAALRDVGVTFATVPEENLAKGECWVLFYAPPGVDKNKFESIFEIVTEHENVRIDNQILSLHFAEVRRNDIHNYRRIGLYNETDRYGVSEIPLDEGLENVQEFVKSDTEPTPRPSETISDEGLVQELADGGVGAIAVDNLRSNQEILRFKLPISPATGYDIVGTYDKVQIDDEHFELRWEFNWIPDFLGQVPVYGKDDITQTDSLTVEHGVSNLESYVADGCSLFSEVILR